jgi:uncharacterized membrane protein (TIGR02234 family)
VKRSGEYALALAAQVIGAGGALLVGSRTWQVVHTPRPSPLPPDVLSLTGRTVDAAATALALVALAGVVAVLATRGWARRVVGAVVAVSGAGLVWRAVSSTGGVGAARARAFVREYHPSVPTDNRVAPHVTVSGGWPWLTAACGVLVIVAGVLVAARGRRWSTLSARYDSRAGRSGGDIAAGAADEEARREVRPDAPVGDVVLADLEQREAARARTVASMWNALDRGDDPTRPEASSEPGSERTD